MEFGLCQEGGRLRILALSLVDSVVRAAVHFALSVHQLHLNFFEILVYKWLGYTMDLIKSLEVLIQMLQHSNSCADSQINLLRTLLHMLPHKSSRAYHSMMGSKYLHIRACIFAALCSTLSIVPSFFAREDFNYLVLINSNAVASVPFLDSRKRNSALSHPH